MTYDEQVEYLNRNPNMILSDWINAKGIFKFIGQEGNDSTGTGGCVTTVRNTSDVVRIRGIEQEEFTQTIRNDTRIPEKGEDIGIEDLLIFKEYQEMGDSIRRRMELKT